MIEIVRLQHCYKLPERATSLSVGYDIYAAEDAVVYWPTAIKTGFSIGGMPPDTEAQVRTRSGLALKGLVVTNSPGTIDPDYTGEVMVIMHSLPGFGYIKVERGQRIAQLVFAKVALLDDKPVSDRSGGLGSTGMV